MKKIMLSIITVLLSFTVFMKVNAQEFVAEVNSKKYESLKDAIDNCEENDEIVLLTDVKENIDINKNITLNLNNKTLTTSNKKSIITISIKNQGTLTIKNGTISDANATNDGGAILINNSSTIDIDNVIFKNNKGVNGGAIKTYGGNLNITNSKFINNSLQKTGNGGAIQIAASNNNSIVTVKNTTFDKNIGTMGSAISISSNSANYKASIEIINVNFMNNNAGVAGTLHVSGKYTFYKITDSTFEKNESKTYGGAIYATEASRDGESTVITNTIFDNNKSARGGAIYLKGTGETPNVATSRSFIIDENSVLKNNKATVAGGALYLDSDSSTTTNVVIKGFVHNNTAKTEADDIFSNGKKVVLHLSVKKNLTLNDCGDKIDGWYNDAKSNRWNAHDEENIYTEVITELTLTGKQTLKAAHNRMGKVIARYIDEEGNKLHDDIIYTGEMNTEYKTSSIFIKNYVLKEVDNEETGVFGKENILITYIYSKVKGTLRVKYIDTFGKVLHDDIVTENYIDTEYTTEEIKFDEFKLKEIKGNKEGKYTDGETTVTYIYEFVGGGIGEGEPDKDPEIPSTGIKENYVVEILTIINIISLSIVSIIKKIY